jgi:hydrogenase maturation protease
MNAAMIDKIVEAVLYEGYVLYPYRPSSVKNRHRWTFGGIYPRAYSESAGGSDPWTMQAQVLMTGTPDPRLQFTIRFLQPTSRTTLPDGQSWQEAVERRIELDPLRLNDLADEARVREFNFPAERTVELRTDAEGSVVRDRRAIDGAVTISCQRIAGELFKITVRVENRTQVSVPGVADRDAASLESFASTHMILNAVAGQFVSLTDPPAALAAAAGECENVGCWPVLVGRPGERDAMLASPIILSDYPEVAAESPGDLFDATEIDEILSLRIMTLTEDEKRQAAATDERVGAMLARTDALARDQLMSLHGTIRGLKPVPSESVQPEQRHA